MNPVNKSNSFNSEREIELLHQQIKDYSNAITYTLFRKILDLLICCVAILPLLLLIPFVWCVNYFTSPGPLFYWQNRVGLNGTVFRMLKLRTMQVTTEPITINFTAENDPRITKIGKWLRKSHLDELPQVYNIFLGQMTLIGPRPERPEFTKIFDTEINYYKYRHLVKPGVTGWAQVNQMYSASLEETITKLDYDLFYIQHRTWQLDFKILWLTFQLILLGKGR